MSSARSTMPKRVKLERVDGGWRYDLANGFCFDITQIKHSGATFDGWWEVSSGDVSGLFQTLDYVRLFLARIRSPYHRYGEPGGD